MSTISERIKHIRSTFNITQAELADMLGVTNAHISKIESGKSVPSLSLTRLICSTFNIREQWLTDGIPPKSDTSNDNTKYNDPVVKAESAALCKLFESITDCRSMKTDEAKRSYLNKCKYLFSDINELTQLLKDFQSSDAPEYNKAELAQLFENKSSNIIGELSDIKNELIKNNK